MIRKPPKKLSTTELTAIITDYNAQREIVAKNYSAGSKTLGRIMIALGLVALIAVIIVFQNFGGQPGIYAVVASLIVLMFFYSWRSRANIASAKKLQEQFRKLVLPTVFDTIEDFRFEADKKGFVDIIPKTIMPEYNRSDWGDIVEGAFNGQRFSINEMHLKYRTSGKSSSTTTVFKGVAVRLQRNDDTMPTLTVRNNRMALTKFISNAVGMGIKDEHIEIADKDIEDQYDVHCADRIYAQKVFSNDGIRLFNSMIHEHATGQLQFAASGSHIYMLIEQSQNFFELPSIYHPFNQVDDIARLRRQMDGFISLFEQMETLLDV